MSDKAPDTVTDIRGYLEKPTARGLANAVSRGIRDGTLPPGMKLPPVRVLAAGLGLAPATVAAAWALLARSGAIRTDGRRGTTVVDTQRLESSRYRRALAHTTDFRQDLSTGVPDPALLPDLTRALQYLTTAATPGSYLDQPVLPELVDVLREDWPYEAEDITIFDGAMDALELTARTLVRFGDRVIVEHPCFPPLLDLLEAIGAEIVGVPLDGHGMRIDLLTEALASPVAAVFIQPLGQNPTGISLDLKRARQLATVLDRHDAPVVEDDSAGAVSSAQPISLGRWIPSKTLHIRSFSKSHGPDLRLAAMSGPSSLIDQLRHRRQLGQGWSSRLLQRILLNLLTDPQAIKQVAYARGEYRRRRAALTEALARHDVLVGGNDGINLWIPVHDEAAATVRLASQGIGVTPGSPFNVLPDPIQHLRLTCGLVSGGHQDLAAILASAADAGSWRMTQ
ncbi:MAG: aminotransferase class I/II-fold pyridoxal phosphate-dependent enzyme [Actinomycetota bacterium]|nr:aminotransferase class I/II-fold pyridoxal phosphate-dependent enzyme [Actinomycetota bacterium]